jgi:hypothetical protein
MQKGKGPTSECGSLPFPRAIVNADAPLAFFLLRESSMIFDTDIGEKMRAPSGFCIAS